MDYQQWFSCIQQYMSKPNEMQNNLESLKQVEKWLEINLNMVKNTIQYIEFYKNFSNTANTANTANASNTDSNSSYEKNSPVDMNFDLSNVNDINKISQEWLQNMQKIWQTNINADLNKNGNK